MSYRQIFYQIVFGTKNRESTIHDSHCHDLYNYIWGVVRKHNCTLYRINGISDHLHIFSDLQPSISLADYVKDIKISSSLWLKENKNFPDFKGWADGYAAFTYSIREKEMIMNYIKNQKEHHKNESYVDELKRLLKEHGVDFNESYI